MKIRLIILLIFCSIVLFAQNEKRMMDSKEFISKTIRINEPNPIYKNDSELIDSIFQSQLTNFPYCKLDTCKITRLLIDNSITSYEDSPDSYRYSMRRFLIFTVFAMSLPPDKSDLYIELAENELLQNRNIADNNFTDTYSGFLILTLLIKETNGNLFETDYKSVKTKFVNNKNLSDKDIYNKGLEIINTFEKR